MSLTGERIKLFATLFVVWILLNGTLAPGTLAVGALAAALVALLFPENLSVLSGLRSLPQALLAAVGFVLYFLKELVKANLRMAAIVLHPALPVKPAIVRAHTDLTHPVSRLLLANAITLTPGTLTVEIKGEWLYVHWVVAEGTDTETATREIVAGFERYLKVMYG